jgi:hypothetical protein
MTGKNRPRQIIELLSTLLAAIPSAVLMAMIPASLGDPVGLRGYPKSHNYANML